MNPSPPPLSVEGPAELFRVLGHETRLRLLLLLAANEWSVGALETVSGIGQPGLSQQLAILRKARLVATRRVAKQVYYSIDPTGMRPATAALAQLGAAGDLPIATQVHVAESEPPRTSDSAASFAKMR